MYTPPSRREPSHAEPAQPQRDSTGLAIDDSVLDPATGELVRGGGITRLTPKSTAVLCLLADRAGQLVSKTDLIENVWFGSFVSDAAVTTCVRELRRAFDDNARRPRIIETLYCRGYRLIARVSRMPSTASSRGEEPTILGREAELVRLRRWYRTAEKGIRETVFVTGASGVGKTALLDAFAEESARRGARIARGQCVDHQGQGELYLPVIDALARLGRGADRDIVRSVLLRTAPTALALIPELLTDGERRALVARAPDVAAALRLQELGDAVEALAEDRTLIFRLEDLQWSDPATLGLVALLARRGWGARLMVVATYRSPLSFAPRPDVAALHAELEQHQLCRELPLSRLDVGPGLGDFATGDICPGGSR